MNRREDPKAATHRILKEVKLSRPLAPWKYHTGEPAPPPRWLIKNILPETGAALIADNGGRSRQRRAGLCISVMTGLPFAGRYRVKRRGAVLYIALEGAGAISMRLEAIASHHGISGPLPFAWRDDCPPLTDDDAVETLCALADQAKVHFDSKFELPIVTIMIDTVVVAAQHKEGGDNDTSASQKVMKTMFDCRSTPAPWSSASITSARSSRPAPAAPRSRKARADAIFALLADRELSGSVKNTRLPCASNATASPGSKYPSPCRRRKLKSTRTATPSPFRSSIGKRRSKPRRRRAMSAGRHRCAPAASIPRSPSMEKTRCRSWTARRCAPATSSWCATSFTVSTPPKAPTSKNNKPDGKPSTAQ